MSGDETRFDPVFAIPIEESLASAGLFFLVRIAIFYARSVRPKLRGGWRNWVE